MIREVDLVSYLPQFMKEYKEPVAALEAENPEFELVWIAANQVLKNRFIETADEYGISRYEQMLGIYPSVEDTLESRRSRVRSRWFNKIPYTLKVLLQKLEVLCDTDFTLTDNFSEGYTLTLLTDLELYGQVEELERIISTMTPCNIVLDARNIFKVDVEGGYYVGNAISCVDLDNISPDFKENNNIRGDANIANLISDVQMLQVTPDFRESNEIKGSSNVSVVMTVTEITKTESEV